MEIIKKIIFHINYSLQNIYDYIVWRIDAQRMKNVDYFNYKKVCKCHKLPEYNPFQYNVGYGSNLAISNLFGQKIDDWNDYVEHGLWYTENVGVLSYISPCHTINRIFTYSNFRKEMLRKYLTKYNLKIPIFTVGPYIRGAENFYGHQKLHDIKKRLGKTLLVIPMHSYGGVDNSFDNDEFVKEIERIKPQFDTVLVCLAFKDAQKGNYQHFLKKGYTLVCNGCPSDPRFLSRHKDLIELADLTMSNGVGTHVGYSISLGVPHYFFYQTINAKISITSKWGLLEIEGRRKIALKLRDIFGKYQMNITTEQIDFVKQYWGDFSY